MIVYSVPPLWFESREADGGKEEEGENSNTTQHNTIEHKTRQYNKRQDKTTLDPSLLMLLAHSNSIRTRFNSPLLSSTTLHYTTLNWKAVEVDQRKHIYSFSALTLRHDSTLARIHKHTHTHRHATRQDNTRQDFAILSNMIRQNKKDKKKKDKIK